MHAWRFPLLVVPQVLTLLTSLAIVVRILRTPLRPRLPDGYSLRPSSKGIARTAPPSPEDTNTLWGSLSYAWMGDMMVEKQEGAMELEDVFVLSMDNRASVLWKRFSSLTYIVHPTSHCLADEMQGTNSAGPYPACLSERLCD